jgi:hypothetical protein
MPDRWPPVDEEFALTPACKQAAHDDCPHVYGGGGGFNPRRLRLEFGEYLCRCPCHASCPVQYETNRLTVSPKTWQTSCTCPGAEQVRRGMDEAGVEFPDFGEMQEEARRRRQLRKEAFQATQARATGKSRAEIREIYVAELRARDLKIPAETILEAIVDHLNGNPLPAARALGETLVGMGKGFRELFKVFGQGG